MKVPSMPSDTTLIIGSVAVAGLLLWWFVKKGNAAAVGEAVGGAAVDLITGTAVGVVHQAGITLANNSQAFVPADPANIVYSGVNDAGAVLSGNENFSLGASIYNFFHPGA